MLPADAQPSVMNTGASHGSQTYKPMMTLKSNNQCLAKARMIRLRKMAKFRDERTVDWGIGAVMVCPSSQKLHQSHSVMKAREMWKRHLAYDDLHSIRCNRWVTDSSYADNHDLVEVVTLREAKGL